LDATAQARIGRIEERHRKLRGTLAEMWEERMRPRYFAPGPRLQALRRRAIELDSINSPELRNAMQEAVAEEVQEAVKAQGRFQRDYDKVCERMGKRKDMEIEALKKESRKKRSLVCQSQGTSPRVPRVKFVVP
jgi:hypothetical protein